jgi:hypothetical protein
VSTGTPGILFQALLDDAAIFPPGDLPLPAAVTAHRGHLLSSHADLVGPFVVPGNRLGELAEEVGEADPVAVAVTTTPEEIDRVLAEVAGMPGVRPVGLEVRLGERDEPRQVLARVAPLAEQFLVHLELPRDPRRAALVAGLADLADTRVRAKLRTGGLRAEDHPSAAELAGAVSEIVGAGLAFKATAGLHHALPRYDPVLGVTQHGFLNLMLAVAAAREGASLGQVRERLEQGRTEVLAAVGGLGIEVRESFGSLGTCSIAEPVADLVELGLWQPVAEVAR